MFKSQTFTSYAADVHGRYAAGKLPLDIRSHDPQAISSWFQQRLAFRLNVPNYPSEGDEPKSYRLSGARLMQFGDQDIAYLAYTMNNRPSHCWWLRATGSSRRANKYATPGI